MSHAIPPRVAERLRANESHWGKAPYYVFTEDGCWQWARAIGSKGYGLVSWKTDGVKYRGQLVQHSTTQAKFLTLHSTTDGYLGATDFTAALATNDVVSCQFEYEAVI